MAWILRSTHANEAPGSAVGVERASRKSRATAGRDLGGALGEPDPRAEVDRDCHVSLRFYPFQRTCHVDDPQTRRRSYHVPLRGACPRLITSIFEDPPLCALVYSGICDYYVDRSQR